MEYIYWMCIVPTWINQWPLIRLKCVYAVCIIRSNRYWCSKWINNIWPYSFKVSKTLFNSIICNAKPIFCWHWNWTKQKMVCNFIKPNYHIQCNSVSGSFHVLFRCVVFTLNVYNIYFFLFFIFLHFDIKCGNCGCFWYSTETFIATQALLPF